MSISFRPLTNFKRIHIGLAIFISLFIVLVITSRTGAATPGLSITMTPSSTEIHAAPGSSAEEDFTIVNQGTTSYPVLLTVAPYRVEGTAYDPQFTLLPGVTDASSWIHFTDTTSPTLGINQSATLNYTLDVPADTAPGGYYAVIFAETNPTASDSGITPHNRVGNIIYITVDGPVESKGTLESPLKDIPAFIWGSQADLGLLVSNTGGVHFITKAHMTVTSLLGRTLFTGEFERYVLPQTQRLVSATWKNLPPIGIYKLDRNATIAGSLQKLPTKYVIVVQPWVGAVVLAIIALVIILGVRLRRTKKPTQSVEPRDD